MKDRRLEAYMPAIRVFLNEVNKGWKDSENKLETSDIKKAAISVENILIATKHKQIRNELKQAKERLNFLEDLLLSVAGSAVRNDGIISKEITQDLVDIIRKRNRDKLKSGKGILHIPS